MRIRNCWLPAIVTIGACAAGFTLCNDPVSPYFPLDSTGKTSIVIYTEGNEWCELRGPARWRVLEDCTGPPVAPVEPIRQAVAIGPDSEGFISNPYVAGGNE